MNKTMKSVVAFAMVSTLAGTALFAAPKPNGKHHSRPAVEGEVKGPEAEFQTLIGKVKVTKAGFVILTTDEDNRYVLTVPENIEKLSMKELKLKDGKRMVLSGKLNKESQVFTVVKIGFMSTNAGDAK